MNEKNTMSALLCRIQAFCVVLCVASLCAPAWAQLAAPANVRAIPNYQTNEIRVTWNAVAGATHYRIYRAPEVNGNPGQWALLQPPASHPTLHFVDTPGVAND